MEEKVNEVKGVVENTTLETKVVEVQKVDNRAENTLITLSTIVLIVGIIASIICLFTLAFSARVGSNYSTEIAFNPNGFATTIMVLFSSLISWGLLKVLANISLTLKDIKSKMK